MGAKEKEGTVPAVKENRDKGPGSPSPSRLREHVVIKTDGRFPSAN